MEIDRFSNLPDAIIQEVLSLIDTTKEAVRTCVLSKNWIHQWTHVRNLSFDHKSFKTITAFEEFVLHVLQHRQPSIKIRKLRFFCGAKQNQSFINGVFDQAMLPELEELETDLCNFPPSLVRCQTLKTLYLGCPCSFTNLLSNSFNFAWLKNLQLSRVDIYTNGPDDDIFSSCLNLVNLRLISCQVSNTKVFNINAPLLSQLIIIENKYHGKIIISAPKVKRFEFKGTLNLADLVINKDVPLDEVTLEMSYPLFSRETNTWKKELREYISALTEWLQGHTKSFNVSLNFYVGVMKSVRGPFDKEIKVIEHKKECNGHLTDSPWN